MTIRTVRRFGAIAVSAATFIFFNGCSNSHAATNANFAKGIARYLGHGGNGRICYSMTHSFPFSVFRNGPNYGYYNQTNQDNENVTSATMDHLHQFVVARFVATANVNSPAEDTNGGTLLYPSVRYSLTTLGKRFIYPGNSSQNAQICYASVTVNKVVDFTIPGQEHGETISTVQWKPDALPDNAIKPLFRAGKLPFLQQYAASQIVNTRSGQAVLTNRGWVYNPGD